MGDKTSRAKVSVALVGVGPIWELHYRAAIERLSSKLSVRAVCDSVQVRAAAVADEFEATSVSSPWLLTQRQDCHAWLILDPGWFGTYPAELAIDCGRPTLFANTFSSALPRLVPILQRSLETGETLMPEFPQRFTPATTRLRELMATKLGTVRRIEVSVPLTESSSAAVAHWLHHEQADVIGLLDWCAWLIGDTSPQVTFHATTAGAADARFDLNYASVAVRPEGARVTIRMHVGGSAISHHIECDRGSATIVSPTQISWQTKDEHAEETLSHERSPHEIILDQFCRRALGGLVPVPAAHNALQAISTAQLALKRVQDFDPSPASERRVNG